MIGTGSELHLCVDAAGALASAGIAARVVSMPSWDLFDAQGVEYQRQVLPEGVPCLAVEAGTSFGWARWADASVSIDHFGASAPASRVMAEFGFTADNVAAAAHTLLGRD